MAKKQQKQRSRGSAGNNRKAGEVFFQKNRQKPGVIETGSGLQYEVLEHGAGTSPDSGCYIIVHQRCQVLNGPVIENTYNENEPSEVNVDELIEGYREGIMLMNKNARYKFFVPPELGWGKKGSGTKIPPNATLIFDVRLIDFW